MIIFKPMIKSTKINPIIINFINRVLQQCSPLVRVCYLVFLSIVLVLFSFGCSSASETRHADYHHNLRTVQGTRSLIFVSDTQSPIWIEKLRLESDNNEVATQKIVDEISRESTCVAMFHLGDITAFGGTNSYWEKFDKNTQAIRDVRIPLYPAFGNHEYMPLEENGKYNMIVRFPFMTTPWYKLQVDSVAIIILNSNFSHLSDSEVIKQKFWYEQTLKNLDNDTTVSLVIVGCHHSPYTNSTIVDPSKEVESLFVPQYVKSRKAKLFVSGHAHALEHFQINGKDFLVIGGGGGLLQPLLQGKDERWHNKVAHKTDRSFFHYVRLTPKANNLTVDAIILTRDYKDFKSGYSFEIPIKSSK